MTRPVRLESVMVFQVKKEDPPKKGIIVSLYGGNPPACAAVVIFPTEEAKEKVFKALKQWGDMNTPLIFTQDALGHAWFEEMVV